jgi:hypothetical protein
MPLDNYKGVVVGPAYTVQYVSASTPPGTVGDFIDDVANEDEWETSDCFCCIFQSNGFWRV